MCFTLALGFPRFLVPQNLITDYFKLPGNSDSCYIKPVIHTIGLKIRNNVIITLLVSMTVKHNNAFTNLVTGCLYWLTTCFGQLYDHHQFYKS